MAQVTEGPTFEELLEDLSSKQKNFVLQYLIDPNATKAALHAKYSELTAPQQGARLLKNVKVLAAIKKAQEERLERTETKADWVLKRLFCEAEADIADIYNDDGTIKPISDWPLIWRQGLVAGIKVNELFEGTGKDKKKIGEAVEVKISDRARRLELIGKHVDVMAFKEKVEHDASADLKEFYKQVSGKSVRPAGG